MPAQMSASDDIRKRELGAFLRSPGSDQARDRREEKR
jgi:hypothetical protein